MPTPEALIEFHKDRLLIHLAEYHRTTLYPPDPDYPHGYIKPDMLYSPDPSPAADIGRAICHAILSTTQANGLCGCRLCRN